MNKKTEELRQIFVEVTDEETVTENQEAARGSLAGNESSTGHLGEIIARMRERCEFETSLEDDELVRIVEGVYAGDSDTKIAESLGIPPRAVFRARLDLHLLREQDTDPPFDLAELRDLLVEDVPTADIADRLDVSASTIRRYRSVVEAQNEARRVSDRYRSEFEDALVDAGLDAQHTTKIREDGLEDATNGTETNVSF